MSPEAMDRFAAELWATPAWETGHASGMAVYRNTVHKACLDALAANYPALWVLVGAPSFELMARCFMAEHPPSDARLMAYGAHLADWLAAFAPAQDWPHLVGVARLDRAWTEAHLADDAPTLQAHHIQRGVVGGETVCPPHPATRWVCDADHPIARLWQDARKGLTQAADLAWVGDGLLLTRVDGVVRWQALEAADRALLEACAQGQSLAQALAAAQATQPDADLAALVARCLDSGALRGPAPDSPLPTPGDPP